MLKISSYTKLFTPSMSGHQIICAVEDNALANLLCRRLPVQPQSKGLHIELGEKPNGHLGIISRKEITNLPSSVVVVQI